MGDDGVVAAFVEGSSNAREVNSIVVVFWFVSRQRQQYVLFHRVEGGADFADGRTRPDKLDSDLLVKAQVVELIASLLGWLVNG